MFINDEHSELLNATDRVEDNCQHRGLLVQKRVLVLH